MIELQSTWQDQDVLDSVIVVLCPLQDFVYLLVGKKGVTVSAVLSLRSYIKEKTLAPKVGNTELTGEMKPKIVNDFNSCYNDSTIHFLQICMFLNPQFKMSYVPNQDTNVSLKYLSLMK